MTNNWMVLAGRGGIYSEDFEKELSVLDGHYRSYHKLTG
jgi:hypothetical protein